MLVTSFPVLPLTLKVFLFVTVARHYRWFFCALTILFALCRYFSPPSAKVGFLPNAVSTTLAKLINRRVITSLLIDNILFWHTVCACITHVRQVYFCPFGKNTSPNLPCPDCISAPFLTYTSPVFTARTIAYCCYSH